MSVLQIFVICCPDFSWQPNRKWDQTHVLISIYWRIWQCFMLIYEIPLFSFVLENFYNFLWRLGKKHLICCLKQIVGVVFVWIGNRFILWTIRFRCPVSRLVIRSLGGVQSSAPPSLWAVFNYLLPATYHVTDRVLLAKRYSKSCFSNKNSIWVWFNNNS